MGITRRRFLGYAAGATTLGLPFDLRHLGRSSLAAETNPRWVLLDLKEHGCLGESVSGFESALAGVGGGGCAGWAPAAAGGGGGGGGWFPPRGGGGPGGGVLFFRGGRAFPPPVVG